MSAARSLVQKMILRSDTPEMSLDDPRVVWVRYDDPAKDGDPRLVVVHPASFIGSVFRKWREAHPSYLG